MFYPCINEFKFTHPYFRHPLGSGGRKSKGFDQTKQETDNFTVEHPEDGDAFADDCPDLSEREQESNSYMGLSDSLICHSEAVISSKPKRVRKGKPIRPHSKRMLKAGCATLQEEKGKSCLSFLTLTLPGEDVGLSAADLAKCNENFHELLRQFLQTLKRRLKAAGVSQEYVCSIEVQEKRWRKRGEVALHAHIVFQSRKHRYTKDWAFDIKDIVEVWAGLVSNLLGYKVSNWKNGPDIEIVKKDAARYLGKYLSKGGKVIDEIIEAGRRDELPSKWDRIADSLRRKVKQGIKHFTRDAKIYISYNLESLKEQGILNWYYEVIVDFSKYEWFDKRKHGNPMRIVSICGEIAKGWESYFTMDNLGITQNS